MRQIGQALRQLSEVVLPEYSAFLNNYKDAVEATHQAAKNSAQFAMLTRRMNLRTKDLQQSQQTTSLEDLLHKPVARVQSHVAIIKVDSPRLFRPFMLFPLTLDKNKTSPCP